MTAQVSRAAADHGLLPQVFARTRAGDTPVAGLIIAGLLGTAIIAITIAPTLGKQFGYLAEASTLFALLTYLGACAAALRYRVRGELSLAVVGGAFCVFVIAWSTLPVLIATRHLPGAVRAALHAAVAPQIPVARPGGAHRRSAERSASATTIRQPVRRGQASR